MKTKVLTLIMSLFFALGAHAGTLRGAVVDSARKALPGTTLKLSGKAMQEQVSYADENGKFEFAGLAAGSYTVTAEMDGFQPVTSELTLQSEGRILEIVLPANTAIREAVTVIADEEPLLRKGDPERSSQIGEKTLDYVPIQEQRFQDILPLVPSVVRGPDGSVNISGARSAESNLLVNGSNVTDPVTGNFAIELPIEAVDNVQVYTNPYSAEYGKFTGGVTKVSTKSGEDKFKFEFNDFMPRIHFTEGFKTQGLEAWKPRVRVSGPTGIRNLYYSQAFTYHYLRTFFEDLPEGEDFIKSTAFDSLTQIDYVPSTKHQMTFTLSFFPQTTRNANLNTFLPVSSTPDLDQRGYNFGFQDRHFFRSGAYLESSFSMKSYDVTLSPKQDLSGIFLISPEGNTGNYFNYQDRNSDRMQWVEAFNFRPLGLYGTHHLRLGVDLARTSYSGVSHYGRINVIREDGSLVETIRFEGSGDLGHSSTELSNYLQDQWVLTDQLALDLGLRADYDSISSQANLSPRLAFSYSPSSLVHTVFKAGIGIFYDKVFLNAADFEQYPSRVIDRYDTHGNWIDSQTIVNRMGDQIRTPRSMTWNVEVDQAVSSKVLLRSNFLVRKGERQFQLIPSGHEFLLTNEGESHYRAWEFTTEYRINKDNNVYFSYVRSSAKGDTNDFNTYLGNFQSPLIHDNAYANLPFDTPNRFLFWGVLRAPYSVMVSPVLEVRTGFPYSAVNEEQEFVGKRNELRFPTFVQLDVRVTRTFRVLHKYDLTVGMKVLNVLNHFNPRDVQNNVNSPTSGTFYNGVGRLFRGAFEIKF